MRRGSTLSLSPLVPFPASRTHQPRLFLLSLSLPPSNPLFICSFAPRAINRHPPSHPNEPPLSQHRSHGLFQHFSHRQLGGRRHYGAGRHHPVHQRRLPVHHHRRLRGSLRSCHGSARVPDPASGVALCLVSLFLHRPWYLLHLYRLHPAQQRHAAHRGWLRHRPHRRRLCRARVHPVDRAAGQHAGSGRRLGRRAGVRKGGESARQCAAQNGGAAGCAGGVCIYLAATRGGRHLLREEEVV